jgi:hypothetical protein
MAASRSAIILHERDSDLNWGDASSSRFPFFSPSRTVIKGFLPRPLTPECYLHLINRPDSLILILLVDQTHREL